MRSRSWPREPKTPVIGKGLTTAADQARQKGYSPPAVSESWPFTASQTIYYQPADPCVRQLGGLDAGNRYAMDAAGALLHWYAPVANDYIVAVTQSANAHSLGRPCVDSACQ